MPRRDDLDPARGILYPLVLVLPFWLLVLWLVMK